VQMRAPRTWAPKGLGPHGPTFTFLGRAAIPGRPHANAMAFHLHVPTLPATGALVHIHANGAWTYDGGDDSTGYGWADEPVVVTLAA
jgi:hypothetical protein